MKTIFETGRTKTYAGPKHARPTSFEEQPFPSAEHVGEDATPDDLAPYLPCPFPPDDLVETRGRIPVIGQLLGVGDGQARDIGNGLQVVGFRRGKEDVRVLLRWTTGTQAVGPRQEGKIVHVADGFLSLTDTQHATLLTALRASFAAMDMRALEAAWHEAGLLPEQVALRRARLLEEHGLDDAGVERAREAVRRSAKTHR